jgi:hypothetical protein
MINPHRCDLCPKYPCNDGPLEITIRKILEHFTGIVGCESFPKIDESENDRDIRSILEYLKHEYCNDHLNNKDYLQYLKFLNNVSKDEITRVGKIEILIREVEESIRREDV